MRNPTGGELRGNDSYGSGAYLAGRGNRPHRGRDYLGTPGQMVYAAIGGIMIRTARPYANSNLSGCVIQNDKITVKMFYFKPTHGLIGKEVFEGQGIGIMQAISDRYPGMPDHVHLEIDHMDPELFMGV